MLTSPWSIRRALSRSRAGVAALLVAALVVSMLSITSAPAPAAVAAAVDSGTVNGTVFQNYTSDPWKTVANLNTGRPASRAVAGVTATAYDAVGTAVGSAVSGADGTYSIAIADSTSSELRVEFSGWSEGFEPAFATASEGESKPANTTGTNLSSVRFVVLNAQKKVTGVDFGLVVPEDVAQLNAPIVTSAQLAGATTGNSSDKRSLIAQPWLNEGEESEGLTGLATFGETGSTWGVAYSREEGAVFTAASLKRMSGLGALGLGGIYRTEGVLASDGSINASAETTPWLDLQGMPIQNSGGEVVDLGAGLVPTEAERGLENSDFPRPEIEVFALSGRVGIGGLAIAPSGSALFAANIHDGNVYAVDTSGDIAPTSAVRIQTPVCVREATPGCAPQVIWATSVHNDRLYIGYTDTGDSPETGLPVPGQSAESRGMKAYVVSTPILDDIAAMGGNNWTPEITVDLGYVKGSNISNRTFQSNGEKLEDSKVTAKRWNSWTDVWTWGTTTNDTVGYGRLDTIGNRTQQYPQPILSGIAFDRDGYMVLGLNDRTSIQSGNRSRAALTTGAGIPYEAVADGDILLAAPSDLWRSPVGAQAVCPTTKPDGAYILECNGVVGERGPRQAVVANQPVTFNNKQGPLNGEFFNDAMNVGKRGNLHNEVALGSVFTYPGATEVGSTTIDPGSNTSNAGIMWFNKENGAATRGSVISRRAEHPNNQSFQKAGGLGGTSVLLELAPVEIGNRVWLDADLNGRQDADEPAINGATVELWTTDGAGAPAAKIATRTTATLDGQPGTYYFRTDDPDVVKGENDHPFLANGDYVLVFPHGTGAVSLEGPNSENAAFSGVTWDNLQRTQPTVTAEGTTVDNDSNPAVETGVAQIAVGGPGQNNHTFDAGWYGTNTYEVAKESNPISTVLPEGTSFTFDVAAAKNFRGEDRLIETGLNGSDQVTETQFTVSADSDWSWTATQALPLGYELELTEQGAAGSSVTWSQSVTGAENRGKVLILPQTDASTRARITATNHFGTFDVTKTVRGDGSERVASNVLFKLEYTVDGGVTQEAWVSQDTPYHREGLPLGAVVKLREVTPVETNPAIEGVNWGEPQLSSASPGFALDEDGWASFTISGEERSVSLGLENTANEITSFTVTKTVRAGVGVTLPDDLSYDFTYSASQPNGVTSSGDFALKADEQWESPKFLVGTVVVVTEAVVEDNDDISWADPIWDVTGAVESAVPGGTSFKLPAAKADATPSVEVSAINQSSLRQQFSLQKTFEGTGANYAEDSLYTVELMLNGVPQPDVQLQGNGELYVYPVLLEPNTEVRVREVALPEIPNIEWGEPTWTKRPSDPPLVKDDDGWVTFMTEEGVPGVSLTLKNTPEEKFGEFRIAKTVSGEAAAQVPLDTPFTFKYSVDGGPEQELIATQNSPSNIVSDLAIGSQVTVTEVKFPVIPGVQFGVSPEWTVNGQTVEPESLPLTFTVTDETTIELVAENPTTLKYGTFRVDKAITGDAVDRVPEDARFVVEYQVAGTDTWVALPDLTKENLSVTSPELLEGSVVHVREVTPEAGPTFAWGTPEFTIGEVSWGEEATFTIKADDATSATILGLENPTSPRNGTFSVEKILGGDFKLTDAEMNDLTFVVDWVGGGREGAISLNKANNWTAGPEGPSFPIGTTIELTERIDDRQLPANVEFTGASWESSQGEALSSDEKVSLTVSETPTPTLLKVKNSYNELQGTFGVKKEISGDFIGASREFKDFSFAVRYVASTGERGTLDLNEAGNWEAISDLYLPVGATVTLTEIGFDQESLPPNVKWDGVVWESDSDLVEISANKQSAVVTIDENTSDTVDLVTLRNSFSELDGAFVLQKQLIGDFELADPALNDVSFVVEFTAINRDNTVEVGTLTLDAGNGWSASEDKFKAGTRVTLRELTPVNLPPNVNWQSHKWIESESLEVSEDGYSASFVVPPEDDASVERFTVENEFNELKAPFSVEKVIVGDFPSDSAEMERLSFEVPYVASDGQTGSLSLNAAGGWIAQSDVEFPLGTEITVSEADVQGLPAYVTWEGHRWVPGDGYVVSPDGTTATFTLLSEDPGALPRLVLENEFDEDFGDFDLEKRVTGSAEELVPEGLEFVVEYSVDSGETWKAMPSVSKGAPIAASPKDIRLGTTVLIREVAPATVDGVEWGSPAFSGAGVTAGVDDVPASFTVTSSTERVHVVLENPTVPDQGQFSVTKRITGKGSVLLEGDPVFTVKYSYASQTGAGEFTVKAGETFTSELIPQDTVVTITELEMVDGLVDRAKWGTPVFVMANGTVIENGSQIVIRGDNVISLDLENPTSEDLPETGSGSLWMGALMAGLLGAAGLLLLLARRFRNQGAGRRQA